MREDLLAWLLPEASASELAALRRVITALRLLRDDARRHEARAAPPWPVVHGELLRQSRLRRRRVLEGLLQAYLAAHRAADSFLELELRTTRAAAPDLAEAWRELLDGPGRVVPPAPDEAPRAVVARLIAAGAAAGTVPAWGEYWRAAAAHVFSSPAEAERAWRRSFARVLAQGARPPLLARFLAGLVAARLDRFRPAAAWALYARHAPLAGSDGPLRRLFGWTALFVGEEARARDLLRGRHAGPLPNPVAEFRDAHPEWAALLGGEPRSGGVPASTPSSTPSRPGRGALGARLLLLAAVRQGAVHLLALDCPRSRRAALLRRSRDLRPPPGSARVSQAWRRAGEPTPECLGGAKSAAVARALLHDERGELCGWLQLESAHGLLPSQARLAELARAARAEVLASARASPSAAEARVAPGRADDPGPRLGFAAAFLAALELHPGVRATWLEPDARGRFEVLAERERSRGPLAGAPCGAVRAALAELARRVEAEPEAAGWGGAAGWVLPLRARPAGRLLALLALEAPRGAPLEGRSLERARARLAACEGAWWASAFRAWHRRRSGSDLVLARESRWVWRAEDVACAALAARAPVLLCGPEGSGRRTLARWLDFRAARERAGRILVLEPLARASQAALARSLATDEPVWLVARAAAPELCARGELAPELARALHPVSIEVPPLSARRAEVPALARNLAEDAARRDGRAAPTWSDEALAILFRQAWPGQVAELRALVEELVLHSPEALQPAHVRAALSARGLSCCERLALVRGDLEAALALTRHRNGNPNATRAARYLGWSREAVAVWLERAEPDAGDGAGP